MKQVCVAPGSRQGLPHRQALNAPETSLRPRAFITKHQLTFRYQSGSVSALPIWHSSRSTTSSRAVARLKHAVWTPKLNVVGVAVRLKQGSTMIRVRMQLSTLRFASGYIFPSHAASSEICQPIAIDLHDAAQLPVRGGRSIMSHGPVWNCSRAPARPSNEPVCGEPPGRGR